MAVAASLRAHSLGLSTLRRGHNSVSGDSPRSGFSARGRDLGRNSGSPWLTSLPRTGSGPLGSTPGTAAPEDISQWAAECACGNLFGEDSRFCRKCGAKRPIQVATAAPACAPPVAAWAEPVCSARGSVAAVPNSAPCGTATSSSACSDGAVSAGLMVTRQYVDALEQRFAATVSQLQMQQAADKDANIRVAEQLVGKLEARLSLAETQQLRVERRTGDLAGLVKGVGDEQQAAARRFDRLQEHVRSVEGSVGQEDEKWHQRASDMEQYQKALGDAAQAAAAADEAHRCNAQRLKRLELQVEELRSAESSLRQVQRNAISPQPDTGVSAAVKAIIQELESSLQTEMQRVRERCEGVQERVENHVCRALLSVTQKLKDHDLKVDQLIADRQESAARIEEQEVRLSVVRSKLDAYDQRLALFSDRVDHAVWLEGKDSRWPSATIAADSNCISDIHAPPMAAYFQAPRVQSDVESANQLESRLGECERALESTRAEFAERSMELAMRAQVGFTDLRSALGSVVEQLGQQRDRDGGRPADRVDSSEPGAAHPGGEDFYERLRGLEVRADEQEAITGVLRKGLPVIQRSLVEVRSALDGAIAERQSSSQTQSRQTQPSADTDGNDETGKSSTAAAAAQAPAAEAEWRAHCGSNELAAMRMALDSALEQSAAKLHRLESCERGLEEIQKMTKRNADCEEVHAVALGHDASTVSNGDMAVRMEKSERELAEMRQLILRQQHEQERNLRELDQDKITPSEAAIEELGREISRQQQEQARILRQLDEGKIARVEAAIEELGEAISRQHEQERKLRELDQSKVARAEATIEELSAAISRQQHEQERVLLKLDPNRIARTEVAVEELGGVIARQQAELAHIADVLDNCMDVEARTGIDRRMLAAPASTFSSLRNFTTEASDQAAGNGTDGGPLSERDAEAAGGHGSTNSYSNGTAQGRVEGAEAGGGGPAPIASSSHGLLHQHVESAEAGDDSGGPTSNSASSTPAALVQRGGLVTAGAQGGASAGEEAAGGGPSSTRPANERRVSTSRAHSRTTVASNIVGTIGEEGAGPASSPSNGHANAIATGGGPESSAGMPRRGDAEDGGGPSRGLPATAPAAQGDGAAGGLEAVGGGALSAHAFREGDGAAGGAVARQQQILPPVQGLLRSGGLSGEADDGGGGSNADRHYHRAGSTWPHSNAGGSGAGFAPLSEGDSGGGDGDGGGGGAAVGVVLGSNSLGMSNTSDAVLVGMPASSIENWEARGSAINNARMLAEDLSSSLTADDVAAGTVSQPLMLSGLSEEESESMDVAAVAVPDSQVHAHGVREARSGDSDAADPLHSPRDAVIIGQAKIPLVPPSVPTLGEMAALPAQAAPAPVQSTLAAVALVAPKTHIAPPICVKHFFFDFDQTVSRIHVFKQLAGWEPGVPAPHSSSERGQIHKMTWLNGAGKWAYDSKSGRVIEHHAGAAGGASWTSACLGGPDRVNELRGMLSSIERSGAKATIITKGNVGAVRYVLAEESLLSFFHAVFGMLGNYYGESEYDQVHHRPTEYEGSPGDELQSSKAHLIDELMAAGDLQEAEAVFIEDDKAEIDSVLGICRSLFVSERRGMTNQHMAELQTYMGNTVFLEPHSLDDKTMQMASSSSLPVMGTHVHVDDADAPRASDAGVSEGAELGIIGAGIIGAAHTAAPSARRGRTRSTSSSDGSIDIPDLTVNSNKMSSNGNSAAASGVGLASEGVSKRNDETSPIAAASGAPVGMRSPSVASAENEGSAIGGYVENFDPESSSSESEAASSPEKGFAGWDSVFGGGGLGTGISIGLGKPSSSSVAVQRGNVQAQPVVAASATAPRTAAEDDDDDDDVDPLANLGIIDSDDASESSCHNSNGIGARQSVAVPFPRECGLREPPSLADVVLPMVTNAGKPLGCDDISDIESMGAESSGADATAPQRSGAAASGPPRPAGRANNMQVERQLVSDDSDEADSGDS